MAKYRDDGESYLKFYPHIKKRWIHTCIACGRQGYKPELPEKIDNKSLQCIMKKTIMQYFEPLSIDDTGFCEVCARLFYHK